MMYSAYRQRIKAWRHLPSVAFFAVVVGALIWFYFSRVGHWGRLRCYNTRADVSVNVMTCGSDITCLSFSPSGERLVSSNLEGDVVLWEVPSGRKLLSRKERFAVYSAVFSPSEDVIAVGGGDPTVRLLDARTLGVQATLTAAAAYHELVWTCDGKKLVSKGSKSARVWDPLTQGESCEFVVYDGIIDGLAVSPDGKTLTAFGYPKPIEMWDLDQCVRRSDFKLSSKGMRHISYAAFSPDGKTLAAAKTGPEIALLDPHTGTVRGYLAGHKSYVTSMIFISDAILVSSGGDLAKHPDPGELTFWDVEKGTMRETIVAHETGIKCLAKSADGKYLASGGPDGCIILWDLEKILAELQQ